MKPQKSQKMQERKAQKKSQNSKEIELKKIYRGVFIADQRVKGRGGRIKCIEFSNKIEVRMKKEIGYLHESEVEWVEVLRYNKKQGRRKKREEKKKQKYVAKEEQKPPQKIKVKKYVLKEEKILKQKIKQDNKGQIKQIAKQVTDKIQLTIKTEELPVLGAEQKSQPQSINTNKQQQDLKQQQGGREQEDEDKSSQQSSEDEHETEKHGEDSKSDSRTETNGDNTEEKKQQDQIVIVAEIKKEISNPFWTKPFVGVIRFLPINRQKPKSKFKEKEVEVERSHISKIMDDFYLDFYPIHSRLPICEIQRNNSSEKILEEYVKQNIKIDPTEKGGKIRNKILDEFECLYALVKFIQWDRGRAYVDLIKIIGKARTIEGQCNCFLYEHELNDFQHKQHEQKPQLQLNISLLHKPYDEMVFTIDPITSTDLDDALSIRKINQSEYQIGIHISDVSSYLHKISREEIAKRTTSVYLPSSTFHMLPEYLVNICSLNPGVERLAFSVFARMNEKGQVLGSRIEKNIVKSRFKLAYEQAQSIITDEMTYEKFNQLHKCSQEEYEVLVGKIKTMTKVGLAHRSKRLIFQIFDNDEIKFELDEEKWPIDFKVTNRFTAQKVVQEFMIIGNIEAAKKATEFDPQNSLIIHHPRPSELSIRQFNEYFKFLNYKFKFQNTLALQEDLIKVSKMQNISEEIKKLCYFKARRAQQTATYKRYSDVQQNAGDLHFALGLCHYTHFTSPMRRIADILVHEVLNASLDPTSVKKQLTGQQLQLANWGRKSTKKLKKDLNEIYFCLMIYRTKKQIQTTGIITSFGGKSISVFIPLLDINRQFMWKELEVDKVFINKGDEKKLDVVIYYDRKDPKKDIIWVAEKLAKIPIKIGCSTSIPLKITLQFQVNTNSGIKSIKPRAEEGK